MKHLLVSAVALVTLTSATKDGFTPLEQQQISISTPGLFARSDAFTVDFAAARPSDYSFPLPVGKARLTDDNTLEISTKRGDAVKAMFGGTVRLSRHHPKHGNVIVVRHDNGLETVYGHNAQNLVKVGQRVTVPAYELVDSVLVGRWKEYVENGGNLVLTCRTGNKDRNGRFPELPFGSMIEPLTGNKLEFYDLLLPAEPGIVAMDGADYRWCTWGDVLSPGADSEVWATYKDEFYAGKPAVTFRRLGKGTVTYVGVDTEDGLLERRVLDKLYARLGIGVMSLLYGITLEYRNGFGIVLNYSDSVYHFTVPRGSRILIGSEDLPTAGVLVFKLGQ